MDSGMEYTPTGPTGPGSSLSVGANGQTARKRVSQACKPCGIKKVKCDGVLPTCGMCQNRGVECEYGESKRKSRHRYTDSPRLRSSLPPPSFTPREEAPPRLTPVSNDYTGNPPATRPKVHKLGGDISSVPPEVATRLFQNYFNYLHPLWPILYKPLYASLDYGNARQMIPPALVAAIFAIASCVETPQKMAANSIIPRHPDPEVFVNEAIELMQYDETKKAWHVANIYIPTITNCQVLTILALQQHGVAEYSRAAMLCGLACSMATQLNLHRPDKSGDPIHAEVRHRLWWNLYILEKMMSCEMGRPVLLRAEETSTPLPSTSEADEFELMSIFKKDQGSLTQIRNTSIKLQTISGLHTTISLCIIMERISREIYGLSARRTIRTDQHIGEAKRMELSNELRLWQEEIEKGTLRLDLSDNLTSVPATITNYVVMYHATILLHRPFIARWSPSLSESNTSPLKICLHAANNICLILEKYFDRLPGLPCDMVFSVFTAASMLLYHSKQSGTEDGFETRRRLKLCIHWLSMLGKSWRSANARQKLLAEMFDLPGDLKPNGQLPLPQTPASFQDTPVEHASTPQILNPFTAINGTGPPPTQSQHSPEDWSFLQKFGDPQDEFFALDVDLRSLLDGGFGAGNSRFI